jgi:minor extracellular serine protease Vpr
MNTADPSLNVLYDSRLVGTGFVQAQKAVNSSVLAMTADELDAIAFGAVPGGGAVSAAKAFTLTNTGSSSATYSLAVTPDGSQGGALVGVSPQSVTVPAGQSATVGVSLSIPAAAFAALPSDDTFTVGPGAVISVRGVITATPTSGGSDDQTLRVPYMIVPRGLSNVVAGTPTTFTKSNPGGSVPPGRTFGSTLPLTNNGIHTGTADLYAWGITDSKESGQPMDVRDVGVQVQPGSAFGVSNDDRGLVFLINTWGTASNQSVNEFDIPIDTNGDGQPDFVVVGVDSGLALTGTFNGQFASITFNAHTGALVDAFFADAPMNGSTVELPALASDLGLSQAPGSGNPKTAFSYSVNAFSIVPGAFVDTTSTATFDPFNPPVSSGDFATLSPGASASLPLRVNAEILKKTPALGWLVASVDDANGAPQADEVQVPANLK